MLFSSPDPLTLSLSKRTRDAGAAALALFVLATGCNRQQPEPAPAPNDLASPTATATAAAAMPLPEQTASPSEAASIAPLYPEPPDTGALNERTSPERVLRFYAWALAHRDWASAAKAWGAGSGVTARTLKASYDRAAPPELEIGKGDQEGAAGSLYYEVPVTLRFGPGAAPESGSLVLRRVNGVDGATPEQLRWHIERSTIGQGQ